MNTFELSLDLDKRSTLQGITIRRGDSDGTTVRASIFDHGSVANLTGATAYLVIRLPDGEHYYRKAATVGTGIVTTTINEAEAASAVGSTKLAYFEISQGGSEYSTSSFAVRVLNDAVAGMDPPESYDDEIAQLVEDWLVAHPEATTTVQDGSITTAKIADGAVTNAKLAGSSVTTAKIADSNVTTAKVADGAITHDKLAEGVTNVIDSVPTIQRNVDRLLGNILIGELAEGTVLTTDDAYAAPPKGVSVFGKSTQAGTPTPDAPVPIESVDNLTLNVAGRNLLTPISSSDTKNGITITPLSDGRVRIDGTATVSTGFIIATVQNTQRGTYTLSGAYGNPDFYKNESMSANNRLFVRVGTTNLFDNSPNGVTFTTENLIPTTIDVSLVIVAGETLSNSVISPQLEYGSTATDYAPHTGQSVPVPLDQPLRGLPDGTRDELTLSYIGPSTREGWGVFSKTLVQRVKHIDDVSALIVHSFDANNKYVSFDIAETGVDTYLNPTINVLCPNYPGKRTLDRPCCYVTGYGALIVFGNDNFADRATAETMLSGVSFNYQLATPVTHDLGTIELPVNPAPDLTAWADGGSAQPTLSMEYERALSIVIPRIEAQLADMATS